MNHAAMQGLNKTTRNRSLEALKIVGIYLVAGGIWILLSDKLVEVLFADPTTFRAVQTYKGSFYVVLTALLLYTLIKRTLARNAQIESALIVSENRYRTLVEQVPAIIYITAPNSSNKLYISPQVEHILGFPLHEWNNNPQLWAQQLYPDDRERVLKATSMGKKVGEAPLHIEYRMLTRDGCLVWFQDDAANVCDEAGETLYLQGLMTDITERKQAEEALSKEHDFISAVLDTAASLVVVLDPDGRIVRFNHACERVSGYTAGETIGKYLWDFLLIPEEVEGVRAEFQKLRSGQLLNEYTNHWQQKNGGLRLMSWASTDILDSTGNVEYIVGTGIDITEKREAEEALMQSERYYRGIFESAHDAIIILDPEREIVLDVNRNACEAYGFSRQEFLGMSLEQISSNINYGKAQVSMTLASNDKGFGMYHFETAQLRKDGTEMFLDINASVVDYHGRPAILSLNRDVTERRQAERALVESERNYRTLMEQASDGIMIADRLGKIVEVNSKLLEMLGYSFDEMQGRRLDDFYPPEEIVLQQERIEQLISGQAVRAERHIICKEGQQLVVEISAKILDDGRLQAIVRDVTERKRTESALRESEEKFRTVFNSSHDAIIITDMDGNHIDLNPAATRLLGMTKEEAATKHVRDIIPVELRDRARQLQEELKEQGELAGEFEIVSKDGQRREIEYNAKSGYISDNLILAWRDITKQKANRKQLEDHNASQTALLRELLTAQEAERRRLSMEIHDGPLQSLGVSLMALDRAMRREERGEHEQAQIELRNLRSNLANIVGEVRSLLTDLSLDLLVQYGLVAALKDHLERFTTSTGIESHMDTTLQSRLPDHIELLVYRLVQEALANVRKHSDARCVDLDITVDASRLLMSISDDGKGFDTTVGRGGAQWNEKLGIRTMRERIRNAQGEFMITSSPDAGTKLTFDIPIPVAEC